MVEAREKAALLRRLAVCDRLWDIAVETKDEELLRKSDQLNQRACDIYNKRWAHLGGGAVDTRGDARLLDRRLGGSAEQSLLPASRNSTSARQAAIRGDGP